MIDTNLFIFYVVYFNSEAISEISEKRLWPMKLFFHFSFYRGLAYLRSCLFKTSPSEILLPRLNVQLVTSSQIKEDHTRLACHARAWEETEVPWGRVKVMLHGTIRKDDFSATQRCNIVATLFQMAATLFQHYNAVLSWKSSLRIVPCNITLRLGRGAGNWFLRGNNMRFL